MGILLLVGGVIAVIGGVWLLITIFQEGGVLWGLASIFIPFVSLIFVVMNWQATKKPFLVSIGGSALVGLASVLGNGSG